MNNQWLLQRREVFERDLIQDFFEAKLFFDTIARGYHQDGSLPFEQLDTWIGTDDSKGPLWLLKDQSHRLFRNGSNSENLYENLFDWTVGSIFHETIKLKEEIYQIESYKPLLEMRVHNTTGDETLNTIIQEYFNLIERANNNVPIEVQSISQLFNKALYHLHEIIAARDNTLILLLLLEQEKNAVTIFGAEQYHALLKRMYPEGPHTPWIAAGRYLCEGGWHGQARSFIEKALALQADSQCARGLLDEINANEHHPDENST